MLSRPLFALLAMITAFAARSAVVDDDGRSLSLAHPAHRIVSVAPGATEMLFAAGAGQYLIATVEYSDVPAEAKRVPRIGDGIAVDMERIVALRPDVVVVWPGGGNPAQIAKLGSLGFTLYHQQVNTLADIPGSLRRLGTLAGTQLEAGRAASDIEARLAALKRSHRSGDRPGVLIQVWNKPIYTVGGRHLITDALGLCGARNIFADLNDMGPAVDVEAVILRDPDVIVAVAPSRASAREWLDGWRKFGKLKAVRNDRLITFPEGGLTRLGPSAVSATEDLCKVLRPARQAVKPRPKSEKTAAANQ
jgi:iron complex transport system substrate-binding protein